MADRFSRLKGMLRGKARPIAILLLVSSIPVLSELKAAMGIESSEEFLIEMAVWIIRLVCLGALLIGFRFLLRLFNPGFLLQSKSNRGQKKAPAKFQGSALQKKLIEYWRQSVQDGNLNSITERELSESKLSLSLEEIVSGKLNRERLQSLKEVVARYESGKGSLREDGILPILLAPIRFRRERGRNSDLRDSIVPFWIPALISSDGEIRPPAKDSLPWIPREFLEPMTADSVLLFGEVKDLERFKMPDNFRDSWSAYIGTAEKLFKFVTGEPLSKFQLEGYSKDNQGLLCLYSGTAAGSRYIENRYNELLDGGAALGVLRNLIPNKKRSKTIERLSDTRMHLGQFQAQFPLSDSQRRAVHHSLALRNTEVLGVTGPPGTGKTTLIQSVIGSGWVDAAIRGCSLPPVTVCCSSSNQATTNILKSFTSQTLFADSVPTRWLPDVHTFGLFCSSKTKSEELTDTLFTLVRGDSTLGRLERNEYVEQAKPFYLSRFSENYFPVRDIRKAISHLSKELWKESELLKVAIQKALYGRPLKLHEHLFPPATLPTAEVFSRLAELDTSHRYRLLCLATHYWEGRWLLTIPAIITKNNRRLAERRSRYLDKQEWQVRSMLTPCLVSTFSMAPEFFGSSQSSPTIDLLIADEAGQVSPEVAAPTLSLSSKAVVIGDTAQLEPVWSVLEHVDRGNLTKFGLAPNSARYAELRQAGFLASSGDLMSVALAFSATNERGEPGIFLSEQRRSVPAIVDFANDLSYNGKLTAIRKELAVRPFPAFGFAHIHGIPERVGRSRRNKLEATAIQRWISANQEKIAEHYKKSPAEAVAVITPFTAQARTLREVLLPHFPGMTVGTVHTLQGAERDIVIFSPAYGSSERVNYLFDQKPNMLNVAVTRARDSFLVFGDTKVFSKEGDLPSNILARFILSAESNQLTISDSPQLNSQEPIRESVERLDTLEQHREALIIGLRTAQKEVLIVSPTISSVAIEHDKIDFEILAAVQRGIRVLVYVDKNLNSEGENFKPNADMGMKMLVAAGAELYITDRIHNKSLVIDDRAIYEGSFNWLSAVRVKDSRHQNMEVSFKYVGPDTENLIRSLRYELNERKIAKLDF